MPRALAALFTLAALVAAPILSPSAASACCADFDRHTPLGWASDGSLLVDAYVAHDCQGASVLDVLSPFDTRPVSRFDRYDGGRRLAPNADPVRLSEDELYEMEAAIEAPDPSAEVNSWDEMFPVPAALARRFATTAQGVCRADMIVVGGADPSDALDASRWDTHVVVSVLLRGAEGYREVASGIRLPRADVESVEVSLLPSPDGHNAVVRVSFDVPDLTADALHWVTLPANAPRPRAGCATTAGILPLRDNFSAQVEDGNWEIPSALTAQEELDAANTDEAVAMATEWLIDGLTRALWWDPDNDAIRVALADAYVSAGAPDHAAEVRRGVGEGPFSPLVSFAPPSYEPADDVAYEAGDGGLGEAGAPALTDAPSARGLSCDAAGGETHTFAVVLPALVLALGFGFSVRRRRRRR